MDVQEIINYIRLYRSYGVGPILFHKSIKKFGSATNAIKNIFSLKKQIKLYDRDLVVKELYEYEKINAEVITINSEYYPAALKAIPESPPFLICLGDKTLLKKQLFGIVGCRMCSAAGRRICNSISCKLSHKNQVIVSGLARGIDREAHLGAIENGSIGVLAGGINVLYPEENRDLYEKMKKSNLLISEAPYNAQPSSMLFHRRNQIIAGMCWGLLVVEAEFNSGSICTANYAVEYGKEIFAIPGHPLDSRSRGVNNIIKNGGTLVECANDILHVSNPNMYVNKKKSTKNINVIQNESQEKESIHLESKILCLLSSTVATNIDFLIRESKESACTIRSLIMKMNLQGKINVEGSNIYKK